MQVREDNATLKWLVADLWLDRISLQQIVQKPLYSRRELGPWTRAVFALSGRRAAGLMKVPRKTLRYRSGRPPRDALRMRLRELATSRVRLG